MTKIFATGGTVDKIYCDNKDDYDVGEPEIGTLLKEADVTFDYSIESILRKDSMHMTNEGRNMIRKKVDHESCAGIITTHGTDGMAQKLRKLTFKLDQLMRACHRSTVESPETRHLADVV